MLSVAGSGFRNSLGRGAANGMSTKEPHRMTTGISISQRTTPSCDERASDLQVIPRLAK
jgi:hypothetical protein